MIYLAVFNVSVLHSTASPLGSKGGMGRRGQRRGSGRAVGRGEVGSAVGRLPERFGSEFWGNRIFYPQKICMCQTKAALICWLINKLPGTKDGRPSSFEQYLHGRCVVSSPPSLPFQQTLWAGYRDRRTAHQVGGYALANLAIGARGGISPPSLPSSLSAHVELT